MSQSTAEEPSLYTTCLGCLGDGQSDRQESVQRPKMEYFPFFCTMMADKGPQLSVGLILIRVLRVQEKYALKN